MSIVVYHAPQTRAVMTLWALEELGVPYEKVRVDLAKGDHKTEAFKKWNPNCKIPTVVLDGTPMFESLAILLYLAERYGVEKKLYPEPGTAARMEALTWATWATVTWGSDLMRVIEASHERIPKERHNAAQAAVAHADVARDLAILEARMAGRSFALGESFSLVDIVYGGGLAFGARVGGVDLAAYPRAVAYMGRLTSRPAFGRASAA